MTRHTITWSAAGLLGLLIPCWVLCGCNTMDLPYVPTTAGIVRDPDPVDGLVSTLTSPQRQMAMGDQLIFDLVVRNVSEDAILVDPDFYCRFFWIYSNGWRDNDMPRFDPKAMVESGKSYPPDKLLPLQPNEEYRRQIVRPSLHLLKEGITEFTTVCYMPRNLTPSTTRSWHGIVQSNPFGINVERRPKSFDRLGPPSDETGQKILSQR